MATTGNAPAKSSPRDAQVMSAILKDMGVTDYDPRLINQMLEFSYRYVTDVLDDAKVYSSYAGKREIDTEDVHLAVQCRMDQSFTTPPPRDLLMEIARHKNSQSLPLIKPYSGPRLPPDRYCLSAPNYKLISNRKKTHRIQIGLPVNPLGPGHRIHHIAQVTKQTNKVQIGTPSQMTVINRPSQVKPIIRVASERVVDVPVDGVYIELKLDTIPGMGQGLLSGVNASLQQQSHPQIISNSQIVTPATSHTLINNPLKRKLEDDYDQT